MNRTLLNVLRCTAVVLAIPLLPAPAAPGDLDPTFGTGGKVVASAVGSSASGVVIQPDGKIVIVGSIGNGSGLARFNANGSLDTTFGGVGSVVAVADGISGSSVNSIVLQPDGKIVAVGKIEGSSESDFAVFRYNADGSPDTSFNGTGRTITPVSTRSPRSAGATCVAIQPDGKIIVGGFASISPTGSALAAVRYHENGLLDTSFNGTGKVLTVFDATVHTVGAVAVQSDGKIVVAGGTNGSGFALVRHESDGRLDSTFGIDGRLGISGTAAVQAMAIQPNGKIIAGGGSNSQFFELVRMNQDGTLDTAFGGTGKVTVVFDGVFAANLTGLKLQADGQIVTTGWLTTSGSNYDWALARTNADGTPDSSFGGVGRVVTNFEGTETYDTAAGLALQSDGKVIVVGGSNDFPNPRMALARYLVTSGPPIATTGVANSVTKSGATLNGTVKPDNATTAYFEYGTTTSYGNTTPSQPSVGAPTVNVQAIISGLAGNTVYHYRMVATNFVGTAYGEDATFTTLTDPPVVATGQPAAITNTGATLNGAVNPNGRTTDAYFEWGSTTLYGNTVPMPAQSIPAGTAAVNVAVPLTGLTPGGTYHCRLVGSNSGGIAYGEDVSFVAIANDGGTGSPTAAPMVNTGAATSIVAMGATCQGTVNPNGGTTFAYVEYGLTTDYGSQSTPQSVGNGTTVLNYSVPLADLAPGSQYHYRIVASNTVGTSRGQDATFTTPFLPPSAVTDAADPGTTFATLNGTVNPNGVGAAVIFEYGLTAGLGKFASAPDTLAGETPQTVSVRVTGLVPEAMYFYRVTATSSVGTTQGAIESFTTLGAQAPVAVADVVFTGGGNVSLNVIANDVNTDTGEVGVGLTFDAIVRQSEHGRASGGPVVDFDPDGGFPLEGDSFDYEVKTAAGLTDVGTVTVLPFGAFGGGYGGTITGGNLIDGGLVTLELGPTSAFTGQLRWQNQKYALRDALGSNGVRTITKQKAGAAAGVDLVLTLQLDRTGLIFADLLDESSGRTLSFVLRRAAASANAVAGTYTATHAQFAGGLAEQAPRGDGLGSQEVPGTGFTVGTVNKRKTAGRLAGRVGDGEPYSGGSRFFADRLALNSSLYPKGRGRTRTFEGSLTGETQFNGDGTLTSVLEWIKQGESGGLYPGGFRNGLQVTGERFSGVGENPFVTILTLLGAQKARVEFKDGDLNDGDVRVADVQFTLVSGGLRGRVLPGGTMPGMNFKVNSQGVFSGAFTHPVTQARTKYFGTFRRNTGLGQGNFRGSTEAGSVKVFKAN